MVLRDCLEAARSSDPLAGVVRIALQRRRPRAECAKYLAALKRTVEQDPPPFVTPLYADMYRTASADGQWVAIALITSVQRSAGHARRLRGLADGGADEDERRLLRRHARDASRHALAYLDLLDLWFPGAVDLGFRSALRALVPRRSRSSATESDAPSSISDLVQLNAAAIRAVVHQILLRSAPAIPDDVRAAKWALSISDGMLRDELRHIADTAVLIERRASDVARDRLEAMFRRGIREFYRHTAEEPVEFSYHLRFGNYP